jgi:hypothetical protein
MTASPPPNNNLLVIQPYWNGGAWVFDDPRVGLVQEPFISGIPAMIEHATRHIPDARKGFVLTFSRTPFPGYTVELDWVREEYGGNWYRWAEHDMEGWLCPALFRYFTEAPRKLYARADPRP